LLIAIWITLVCLWTWRLDEDDPAARSGERMLLHSIGRSMLGMIARRTTWLALIFALTGGAAFEAAGALRGPYLVDHGVPEDTIGWFFALPSTALMLIGGLAGGVVSDRWGRVRCVAGFLLVIVASVAALALLPAAAGTGVRLWLFAALYAGIGLFTVASYALFMDLSDPVAGATQFTLFMAATNACEAWSGWAGGQLVERGGYAMAFMVMAAVSAVSLACLPPLARNGSVADRD
jgi:MFS transporter, PAT family, beta-lactamase induction signal transducer AmpG